MGTGLDVNSEGRIFEPFTQLSNAAAHDGFGLGLSLVKTIVEKMNGKVSARNGDERGSVFMVNIPMEKADEKSEVNENGLPTDRSYSVLLIDNDAMILSTAHQVFCHIGATCDTCTNVEELMDMMRNKHYDVIITDLKMQDMSGYDIFELLRNANVGNSQTIPVIVSTMSNLVKDEELRQFGFCACLFKPYSAKELVECVESCIDVTKLQQKDIDVSQLAIIGDETEMLDSLAYETSQTAKKIANAANEHNLKELSSLVHHLIPSWSQVQAEQPLRELYLAMNGSEKITDEEFAMHIRTIQARAEELLAIISQRKGELQ